MNKEELTAQYKGLKAVVDAKDFTGKTPLEQANTLHNLLRLCEELGYDNDWIKYKQMLETIQQSGVARIEREGRS